MSSQCRHASTIGQKLVKQQCLPHMSSQYGELRPTSRWDWLVVWDTPTNFNGFRNLASLLQRRRSTEANQTLHNVWPSPGLVHYIYIFWGSCSIMECCHVQKFTFRPSLALSYIGSVTALHSSNGRQTNCGIEQRAPPIFGRAAITLGIDQHSSCSVSRLIVSTVMNVGVSHLCRYRLPNTM